LNYDVGIDLEPMTTQGDCQDYYSFILSLRERVLFDGAADEIRTEMFLRYWTRKEACLKALGTGFLLMPNKIDVSFSGQGEWTAADIQKASNEVEILNPELHIATLNKNLKLDVEIRVGKGVGYIPAAENISPDQTIGVIPIDSIFTPIKNVKYDVENVRIGDKADYEKLTLDITTDGSITPDDAITQAAKILREHIQLFINFDIEQEEEQAVTPKDTETDRLRKILLTPVDDLELSVRSHNCLKAANIKNLADLVRKDEAEMLKFRNFGRKSLSELMEIVETLGLEFGMDVDKYIKEEPETT